MKTNSYKQYKELKKKYPEAVILYRTGDFYEIFEDDAETCNKVLEVSLEKRIVTRGCTNEPKVKAKFPCCEIDTNIPKLVRAGYRVAICKNLVKPK